MSFPQTLLFGLLAAASLAAPSAAQALDCAAGASVCGRLTGSNPVSGGYSSLLVDNGPFITGLANGFGGADTSVVENGYNTYGYSHSSSAGFRVADDFTVPAGATWTLSTLSWFAYQTGSTTTSTLTAVNVRLWNGSPSAGGSVIAGDTSTNRLLFTAFTNIYRVLPAAMNSNQRPIMTCAIDMSWAPVLAPGTYYLDIQASGSLANGPLVNPKVPRATTDNALQFNPITPPGGAWVPMADGLSGLQQDLPFKLDGTQLIVPVLYCTAKTNGLGCTPSIDYTGVASATSGSGFVVRSINNRNRKSGLLFYGISGPAGLPFQGAFLCVSSPIKRTPSFSSGGSPAPANDCSGVYSIDMNLFAVGGLGGTPLAQLRVVGTTVNCQFWGRDPGFPAPDNTSLSDALQYVVGP